jgi:hypothetical protein
MARNVGAAPCSTILNVSEKDALSAALGELWNRQSIIKIYLRLVPQIDL